LHIYEVLFFFFLQTVKGFLPKMIAMDQSYVVPAAGSSGLFAAAGSEVSSYRTPGA